MAVSKFTCANVPVTVSLTEIACPINGLAPSTTIVTSKSPASIRSFVATSVVLLAKTDA
jgi:hypothetical protein